MTTPGRALDESMEWLEADGLGGFASGTVTGLRTRRYHALLLAATTPPTGRLVLVNGLEAWVEAEGGRIPLSTQLYAPDVSHPDGRARIVGFRSAPWPTWRYRVDDGAEIVLEIIVPRGRPEVALRWRLEGSTEPPRGSHLRVRPLLSGRDMHALHHENPAFRFDAEVEGDRVVWRPYEDLPEIACASNGAYTHDPLWYRSFLYAEERARGLDHVEDLASPGGFSWPLDAGDAVWILSSGSGSGGAEIDAIGRFAQIESSERARRAAFPTRLHRAADAYLVRRGDGATVIAGYPWFGDWGRDTFISLRGLCLATGRLAEAGQILRRWADEVSSGMLPNRFVEQGDEPEFNSVDAALWYVVAVDEFVQLASAADDPALEHLAGSLERAVDDILTGYADGTRHRIRADADGLLAAGEPGVQLTWMDAKVGDWVVTPRIGKPVEIQALWINALAAGGRLRPRWAELGERARASFAERFWNEAEGCLFDVVDVGHEPGAVDPTIRPNQILAVGGLPMSLIGGDRARRVVDLVEERLWTPLGLRSLDPADPAYRPRYEGGVLERDGAYHQGTVWPWLIGPFMEAWLRVRGDDDDTRHEAWVRFLAPLLTHLDEAGLGHISEVADAETPHAPGGAPFQAWSVGEALRLAAFLRPEPSARTGRTIDSAPAPGGPADRSVSSRQREGVTP